ncbi:MAG: aldehyde dehydrogenase family protein [Gemmataceae bacterium]
MPLPELTAAARAAQRPWADLTVSQRLKPIRALRRLIVAGCDRLLAVLADELGKPAAEALGGELLPTADGLAWLERRAAAVLAPRRVPSADRPITLWGQADTVHRRPRGVVGVIGTWNYPLYLNAGQIAQALAAGNAVIWKPSEVVPRFAEAFADLMAQAGFPPGLFQPMPATREGGAELAEADIDHVVFTGSATVGRKLAARLGERLVTSTMELSGCDAMLILDDADLAMAAKAAAFALTLNRGQTCIAVRRIFVPRPRAEEFVRLLAARIDPTPLPLKTAAQEAHARRVIDDAVAAGARRLTADGPAVLLDVRPEMAVCREASFAPVMGVLPYDTLDEALEAEGRCPFALSFSVFTADPARGRALAGRLRSGTVCVNDVIAPTTHPSTPFGGRGESGWGVTQGAEGLLEMTVPQAVSVRGGSFRPHYERAANQESLLRGLLAAGHGPTLWRRLGGWWRVARAALG